MTKPVEILVVEDKPAYIEVAKSVYDNDINLNTSYASTYEEALSQIGQRGFEGVVTDLFFSSNTVSAKQIYMEIGRKLGVNPKKVHDTYGLGG